MQVINIDMLQILSYSHNNIIFLDRVMRCYVTAKHRRCVLHNRPSQGMSLDVVESREPCLVKGGLWLRDKQRKDIVQTDKD